ncbi:hypothetical protein ABW19_dt0200978 [Dactylella cylindrospora]|nr:hypothetical protein ABW19_dt0200978 [Dactylella cylindrospora]
MKILIFAVLSLPFATAIEWVSCDPPQPVHAQNNIVYDRGFRRPEFTTLVQNFESFLHLLSARDFVEFIRSSFSSYELNLLFREVEGWENGRALQYPLPMFALRDLLKFSLEHKLHCATTPLDIAQLLARIDEVDTTGWVRQPGPGGPIRPIDRDANIPIADVDSDADDHSSQMSLNTEHMDPSREVFQFINNSVAKQLLILIWTYYDQLGQLAEYIPTTEGGWNDIPEAELVIRERSYTWRRVYRAVKEFAVAMQAFGVDVAILRRREATERELQRLASGKRIEGWGKRFGKKLGRCFTDMCDWEFV